MRKRSLVEYFGNDDFSFASREASQRVGGGDNNFSRETGTGYGTMEVGLGDFSPSDSSDDSPVPAHNPYENMRDASLR
jgi:hypothetical protein